MKFLRPPMVILRWWVPTPLPGLSMSRRADLGPLTRIFILFFLIMSQVKCVECLEERTISLDITYHCFDIDFNLRNSSTANINLDSELPGAEVRLLSKLFICMYWKSIPNCLTAIVFKVTKIPLSWRVALAQSEARIKVTWSFSTNQRPVSRSLDHSRPRQYGTFHFWRLP